MKCSADIAASLSCMAAAPAAQKPILFRLTHLCSPAVALPTCPSFIYPTMSNEKGQEIYDATAIEATLVRKINWTAIPLLNIIQTIQVKGKYLNAC